MTARFHPSSLPADWQVALWDPRNFAGPEGIAIVGIRNGSTWRSPIPQIDQRRLFGSYSKPLLVATADALDLWISSLQQRREHILKLNLALRGQLSAQIPSLKIVGDVAHSDPRFLAIVAANLIAEETLRKMEELGILIDAGSACSAGALAPSHVLAALGLGSDGHLRITLKENQTTEDIAALVTALSKVVAESTN
jgi:cysteine desulfurase